MDDDIDPRVVLVLLYRWLIVTDWSVRLVARRLSMYLQQQL